MKIKEILNLVVISLALLSCTTTRNEEWREIEDHSQAKITLQLENVALNRTGANALADSEAWLESGWWESQNDSEKIQVWISVYALFDKIFSSDYIQTLEESVRELSGDGYLILGNSDQIVTNTGLVRIQYYNVSGLACFYVENYWLNGDTLKHDRIRYSGTNVTIAGNSLLQAYYCQNGRDSMAFEDAVKFLHGISVKDVYWPEERFTSVEELELKYPNEG